MSRPYQPPFSITPAIATLVGTICEAVGRWTVLDDREKKLRLQRSNRIRTIRGTLAIEGNRMSEAQVTAILDLPVEHLVFEHQDEYYQALRESTRQTDCAPFIVFMLTMIHEARLLASPHDAPQVTPQVAKLLLPLQGEMSRAELQQRLQLQDRKSFRERYLKPALANGLIEMCVPDRPSSRMQRYRLTEKGRLWLRQA